MPKLLRNILALVAGFVIGSAINMALVMLGHSVISPPAGIDVNDPESFRQGAHLFESRHFVFPFLAHAIGTFVGALTAFFVAASHKPRFAYGVGAMFLFGGIVVASMIPVPGWFLALDLLVAYMPMAALAVVAGRRLTSTTRPS